MYSFENFHTTAYKNYKKRPKLLVTQNAMRNNGIFDNKKHLGLAT